MVDLASILTGGIAGIIGKAINTFMMYKMKKDEFKHGEKMAEIEIKGMASEAKARSEYAKLEFQGLEDLEEARAFKESLGKSMSLGDYSYKSVAKILDIEGKWTIVTIPISIILITIMTIIDCIRVLMRPAITTFYTGILAYIGYQYLNIIDQYKEMLINQNAVQLSSLISDIVNAVVFITITCTIWWFGERADKRLLERLNKQS